MRKGFTIIELLVASLLLGMLVTILTMIFNQSSIAWRTGVALTVDLDDARENIAIVREQADNAFVANNRMHFLLSPWKADGTLRERACNLGSEQSDGPKNVLIKEMSENSRPNEISPISVGSAKGGTSLRNYTVNVMSAGPDKEFDTWDDIWSFPDDPNEW